MASTDNNHYLCGLRREDFQTTINGKKTDLYILRNESGVEVALTNYGGAICALMVPDKNGEYANVIQGHDNIQSLINSPQQYLSTICGRFANRIGKGKFQLGGKQYSIFVNNGPNVCHGGKEGWNRRVWDAQQMSEQSVVLNYTSPYGEEGFSGEVRVSVEFTLTDDNELCLEYLATTNKKTVINLTHHAFFCLQGMQKPTPQVTDQVCEINADFYLPSDEYSLPTGEILKVEGTPFDFRKPKAIGQDIDSNNIQIQYGHGFDHCMVLNKNEVGEMAFAARLQDPKSGRQMEVYTDQPAMMFYTDNWDDGYEAYKGCTCERRSAVCFECHGFPDAPNRPYFPSSVLRPGEQYKQKTVYKFSLA